MATGPAVTAGDHLCGPCRAARQRWLDYRPPLPLSITYGSGAAYDASPRGINDARRARFEHWRETIRWHQQQIDALCALGNHVALERPPQ